jgi:3'-phosphoadenosine 5'-phosphosulfate sulfotransferase (PAPS reductase)/FAD synthetase
VNYVLFASYGNDSVALIQWAHEQGLQGLHVAYSDTGWAAPWWADRLAAGEAWAQSLGFATHRIGSEGMHGLVRRKKAWPRGGGGKYQFCTEALKERPAVEWMAQHDPAREATCMVGVRRAESANRANWPEWTQSSEKHDGRELWAPLVRHTDAMRDALVARTPLPLLATRSKECWPCANANKGELKHMDGPSIARVQLIELEAGINGKGNARVMFSPARHGGAVGIAAVVEDAKRNTDDLFATAGCDGGWCGT